MPCQQSIPKTLKLGSSIQTAAASSNVRVMLIQSLLSCRCGYRKPCAGFNFQGSAPASARAMNPETGLLLLRAQNLRCLRFNRIRSRSSQEHHCRCKRRGKDEYPRSYLLSAGPRKIFSAGQNLLVDPDSDQEELTSFGEVAEPFWPTSIGSQY